MAATKITVWQKSLFVIFCILQGLVAIIHATYGVVNGNYLTAFVFIELVPIIIGLLAIVYYDYHYPTRPICARCIGSCRKHRTCGSLSCTTQLLVLYSAWCMISFLINLLSVLSRTRILPYSVLTSPPVEAFLGNPYGILTHTTRTTRGNLTIIEIEESLSWNPRYSDTPLIYFSGIEVALQMIGFIVVMFVLRPKTIDNGPRYSGFS